MPVRSAPSFALAVLVALAALVTATAAGAADLPAQTRLGAVFAEPAPAELRRAKVEEPPMTLFPWPYVAGYYGPHYGAFEYRSYYGTRLNVIFGRYPYNCLSYACSP